jgi:hypothetical protein
LIAIEELEGEGLLGRIGFKEIEAKMKEKGLILSKGLVWELALLGFVKHSKTSFYVESGYTVMKHLWRLAKDKKHSISVIKIAISNYEKALKVKNDGILGKESEQVH